MAPTVNRPSVEIKLMATILIGFTVMGICHFLKTGHHIGRVFCFLSYEEVQKCLLILHFIGCSFKSYFSY